MQILVILLFGPLLTTVLLRARAADPRPPAHHFVPVWEPHPSRPFPIHRQYRSSSAASTSGDASTLSSFRDTQGRPTAPRLGEGALQTHPSLFQPIAYPLYSQELAHLYAPDGSKPADPADYPKGAVFSQTRHVTYRPDPTLLDSIRNIIANGLRSRGYVFKQADPPRQKYPEGVYLLPPLERSIDKSIKMAQHAIDPKMSDLIYHRFRTDRPYLFKLAVSSPEGTRHVLIAPVRPAWHVTLSSAEIESSLWFFFESRLVPHSSGAYKNLAFLGTMFLPKETEPTLLATQTISPLRPL